MPAKPPGQLVRETVERYIGVWQPYRDAMREERRFIDGDRYQDDQGLYQRDRRRNQIRGQEIFDTVRHISAEVTSRPRSVEARPIGQNGDADDAELAVSLLDWELSNPWKGFEDLYENAIVAARESRLGVVWADWDPDCGPFGEIIFSEVSGEKLMWDPAYDPHHPLCSFFLIEKRLDVDLIHETYKGSEWVVPDRQQITDSGDLRPGVPIANGSNVEHLLTASGRPDDNKATLWFCYYKNDRTVKGPTEGDYAPIKDPGNRYMACAAGCDYRSDTQAEMQNAGEIQGDLPERMPMACPHCAGDLKRIDAEAQDEYRLAYSRGKRLIITAPLCAAPDDGAVYDGEWPLPSLRSFPCLVITAYSKPGRLIGPSDTTLMWDQQFAWDQLRTTMVQRIYEHRNYWIMPRTGILDRRGRRYEFRDDQFNVMYRDQSQAALGPLNVERVQGTGLDPMFPFVASIAQAGLTQYRGVQDFGLTPDNSKNIAASTVAQLNQIGNIPIAHFKRRCSRALGKFYGVVWDMMRATYTPRRLARLNLEGTDVVTRLSGDSLANYDFVISESPEFTGIEKDKADAFDAMFTVILKARELGFDPSDMLDAFAEIHNLPRSVARKIQKMLTAQGQAAAPGSINAGQGESAVPTPPPGGNLMSLLAATTNGGNAAGMSPAATR